MDKISKKIINWFKALKRGNNKFVYFLAVFPLVFLLMVIFLTPGLIGIWALQLIGAPVQTTWGSVGGASLIYFLLKQSSSEDK